MCSHNEMKKLRQRRRILWSTWEKTKQKKKQNERPTDANGLNNLGGLTAPSSGYFISSSFFSIRIWIVRWNSLLFGGNGSLFKNSSIIRLIVVNGAIIFDYFYGLNFLCFTIKQLYRCHVDVCDFVRIMWLFEIGLQILDAKKTGEKIPEWCVVINWLLVLYKVWCLMNAWIHCGFQPLSGN